ncbi:MAG: RDD family protein [Vicinamibacterales bacterium]
MKCPKCGYLGYERVERCRNCGYEFSLTPTAPPTDLRIRDGSAMPTPLEDLDLVDSLALDRSRPTREEAHAAEPASNGLTELPLFGPPITDDVPLITRPSRPRPPLAVRRATPEVPRLRQDTRTPLLEWPVEPPSSTPAVPPVAGRTPVPAVPRRRGHDVRTEAASAEPAQRPASLAARGLALVIDLAVLAIVDVVVVYFTLKICGIDVADWTLLPRAPLVAFLVVQNGGYLVAFTAAGQTIGKLVAGIRVLSADGDDAPDLGRAALRTLLWVVLTLPAGLGLLTAAFGRDGRGLHDRFAGTRVVRAGV